MNGTGEPTVSVIIPAHDEGAGIAALLAALGGGNDSGVELIVVCNGCTDDTAERARAVGPAIVVLELPEPSKRKALAAGDALATHPFRAWVDADVVIDAHGLRRLVRALGDGVEVAAPTRRLDLSRSSWPVRWYYDVWLQLPQVRDGVFGRGVVVMTPDGHRQVCGLPLVMSDDLAVSETFRPAQRAVVAEASVTIRCPANLRDLLRRRVRVATGSAQLDQLGLRSGSARTRPSTILRIAVAGPSQLPKCIVFLAVTLIARAGARRRIRAGDYSTWLRDESSRT